MQIGEVDRQQSVIYLSVLVALEILLFIFSIVSAQQNLMMFSFLRLLLLIGAHCMKNVAWAAYYTIFALIASLICVDPVGLWITGHGERRTKSQNAFAFMLLLGCIVAVVVGYFYKKSLQAETQEDFVGDAVPVGYSNPNERKERENQYLYRAAENSNSAPQQQQKNPKRFQQFSGEAYALN